MNERYVSTNSGGRKILVQVWRLPTGDVRELVARDGLVARAMREMRKDGHFRRKGRL